ncbi:PRC-barrel domain-containing protein [Chloroflexota bacterium]
MNTSELFGKEVLDSSANKIGKVVDLDFDMQTGMINHIVIKAGLTKRYTVSLDKIDKIGDRIVLKIGQDELQKR